MAHAPPVPDQLVRELNPLFPRDNLHQILLHLFRILIARQIQPLRESQDVRIHHDPARDPIRRSENDIARLSCHARQRQYFFHRAWHFSAESLKRSEEHTSELQSPMYLV